MKRTKNAMLATVTVMLFTTGGATGLALVRSGGEEGGGHGHGGGGGHDESGEAGHDESGEAGHDESGEAGRDESRDPAELPADTAPSAPPTGLALPPASSVDEPAPDLLGGHDSPSQMRQGSQSHGHTARPRRSSGHQNGAEH